MRYEAILESVQEACGLERDIAAHALKTLLETLGEVLPETERDHLAAQLPDRLKSYLYERPPTPSFPLEEFYTRVAAREELRYAAAVKRIRCVARTFRQAFSEGQMAGIRAHLRSEYGELFGNEPQGPLSPSAV